MNNTIILASKSPRRIELMKKHGYNPIVQPSQADENLPDFLEPKGAVMYLAFLKCWDVTTQIIDDFDQNQDFTVIGSDTVVVYENKIIGKPKDKDDAYSTLTSLRNNCHQVVTGVSVIKRTSGHLSKLCFYEETNVYFKDYTDEELLSYLDTDEAYDKAGGYAIQGTFGKYIDHFEGDYDNVVGLPITKLMRYI